MSCDFPNSSERQAELSPREKLSPQEKPSSREKPAPRDERNYATLCLSGKDRLAHIVRESFEILYNCAVREQMPHLVEEMETMALCNGSIHLDLGAAYTHLQRTEDRTVLGMCERIYGVTGFESTPYVPRIISESRVVPSSRRIPPKTLTYILNARGTMYLNFAFQGVPEQTKIAKLAQLAFHCYKVELVNPNTHSLRSNGPQLLAPSSDGKLEMADVGILGQAYTCINC